MNIQVIFDIFPFVIAGFAAQMVDGALGMAFGVISSTILVSIMGIAPTRASASIHLVELFTTAASGISHIVHKNIDWRLFLRLAIPGAIGGIAGAYFLSNINASIAKPFVMTYLTGLGIYLLFKAYTHDEKPKYKDPKFTKPLGLLGGFLDAAGGGGWGPVVTSNLLVQGAEPRKVIGTVNTVEFFLTLVISISFIANIGFASFTKATIGILIGGILAAPFGAYLAKIIKPRTLLTLVGFVLMLTSIYSVYKAVFSH
jgi:uncharacterized membrane protein YfcA